MSPINGVICNLITFYNKKLEIIENLNSLLIRHVLTNDSNSLLLFGDIGKGYLFSDRIEEKIKLIDLSLNITERKIPILVGLFGNSPDEILNQMDILRKKFEDLNYLIFPPISEKITLDSLESYLETILGASDPKSHLYLNNNPLLSGNNEIEPELLKNLIEFPNLKGLNDSFYNIKKCKSFIELINEDFSVFCGLEENSHNFFQLLPINKRKNSGIVSSISNLANLSSKLYYYALEDNLLELLQLQEQINDTRNKIYDFKSEDKEILGLKYAFLHLYKDLNLSTDEDIKNIIEQLQNEIDQITKERIEATVNYLLNRKQIYKLYSIGKKDLYQFHDIIQTFSKIDILVQQGNVKKIKGPYNAEFNTIYKVKFENDQLVFRFQTSLFSQHENLIKEKLLYPFLDKKLTPNDLKLREKIKTILNAKAGTYIFDKGNLPIIPVGNLIYYDETKEIIPYNFSVQEYIRGKPLLKLIEKYCNEGKNLEVRKFLNLFEHLGEHLGNLHQISFDSFYKKTSNIGKKKEISYIDHFNTEIENALQQAKKNNIDFTNEIGDYFKENRALIEDESEFVILHNDFQSQNIIVKEDQGIIHINGLVDFDDWSIGVRAQDFIKIDYLTLKSLNLPSLNKALYGSYSRFYDVDRTFKKKIEFYKLLWLLKEYNFESELGRSINQNIIRTTSNTIKQYLNEIETIIR
jgi:dihydrodipicolinate synthase/N-acetylneuraminate lyase/aminoglycoside phosphotransferase (APT) family kinase protein